jgi:formylglycine-generating enzyme required for sulfatase activity
MLRAAALTIVSLWVLAWGCEAAPAPKRVALVIGNGAYTNAPSLTNPKNDAQDMGAALKKLGFEVILGTDLGKSAMDRKILDFEKALAGAEAGVFHYSGHGLQVAGVNYLVPVDASLESAAALRIEAVRLDFIQETMERQTKTNILFLDACRNNPLARNLARTLGTRSAEIGKGLAAVESGAGTLISFSTQPGNVALDGAGRNSPYSGPLVKALATPREDVLSLLTGVRNAVMAATGDKQVPWDNNALRAKFYFSSAPKGGAAAAPLSADAQAWSVVQNSESPAVLEEFGRRFPDSPNAGFAKARVEELGRGKSTASLNPSAGSAQQQAAKQPDQPATQQVPAVPPKPAETQTAAVTLKPPVISSGAECDGLLVSVAEGSPPCIKPGSGAFFKDCANCPEMVIVPAGSFTMGSPESELGHQAIEGPQHEVTFAKPFAVGRLPVTFTQWDACEDGGGCHDIEGRDVGWGREDRPVVNVSWDDAQTYLKWLSQKTGRQYRLLSEAEREYVTRAGTQSPFWWGNSITSEQANYFAEAVYNSTIMGTYRVKTVPANSFAPNPWGLYQVHGNVYDWTEDCWHESYRKAPADGSAWTTGDCTRRVLRGGSWVHPPWELRSAYRMKGYSDNRYNYYSIRVAVGW